MKKIYLGNKGETELELADDDIIHVRPLAKNVGGVFDIPQRKAFRVETWDGLKKSQKYVYYKMDTRYDTCMRFETKEEAKAAAEEYYRANNKVWKDTNLEIKAKDINEQVMKGYRFVQPSIEYEEQDVPLDPYFVGMWLGDGTSLRAEITNIDEELIEYCHLVACKYGVALTVSSTGITYRMCGDGSKGGNTVLNHLRQLQLIGNKHIPRCYLENSTNVRLAVLAGLIDTDGNLDNNTYDIVQKNEGLAHDIVKLATSLGIYAELRQRISYATNTIDKHRHLYHRVRLHILSQDCVPPVLLPRKQWKTPSREYGVVMSVVQNSEFRCKWTDEKKKVLIETVSAFRDSNGRIPWTTIVLTIPAYAGFTPDSLRSNYTKFVTS